MGVEYDFIRVVFLKIKKKPIVGMSGCLSPVNFAVCINGVDVWVSFFSSSTVFNSSVFMLAVVQGHYVMLIRAPHLEKCH